MAHKCMPLYRRLEIIEKYLDDIEIYKGDAKKLYSLMEKIRYHLRQGKSNIDELSYQTGMIFRNIKPEEQENLHG